MRQKSVTSAMGRRLTEFSGRDLGVQGLPIRADPRVAVGRHFLLPQT
jgi:hypothetical protein